MKKLFNRVTSLSLCLLFSAFCCPFSSSVNGVSSRPPAVEIRQLPEFVRILCKRFDDDGFPKFPDTDDELTPLQRESLRDVPQDTRLIKLRLDWMKQYMDVIYNFSPNLRVFINWKIAMLRESIKKIGIPEHDRSVLRDRCLKMYDKLYYMNRLNDSLSCYKGCVFLKFGESLDFEDSEKAVKATELIFSLEDEPVMDYFPAIVKSYMVLRGMREI